MQLHSNFAFFPPVNDLVWSDLVSPAARFKLGEASTKLSWQILAVLTSLAGQFKLNYRRSEPQKIIES